MSNLDPTPPQYDVYQPTPLSRESGFMLKFWGVRGLIPTPGKETSRYGGNTACTEIYVGGKNLVFDGGTGLRILGNNWLQPQQKLQAHIFFTNSQSDRIQGFPFFAPAFQPQNCFHIYGGASTNGASIKQYLCDQMLLPRFPYPLQAMESELQFHNLVPGQEVSLDDVVIKTALINQIQKSMGYRVTWHKYSIAYITDLQLNADLVDVEYITHLSKGVDLLVANPTYIHSNMDDSHSSDFHWQNALNLAQKSGAKQLVFSNYRPNDTDELLDQILTQVKTVFPQTLLASEGLVVKVV